MFEAGFQIVSDKLFTGSLSSNLIPSHDLNRQRLYICTDLYHALLTISAAPCLRLALEECSHCSEVSFMSEEVRLFRPL